jgi:hypothetical protein
MARDITAFGPLEVRGAATASRPPTLVCLVHRHCQVTSKYRYTIFQVQRYLGLHISAVPGDSAVLRHGARTAAGRASISHHQQLHQRHHRHGHIGR